MTDGHSEVSLIYRTVFDTLPERQREVLRLTSYGYTNKEVGIRLYLSDQTIKNTLTRCYKKLAGQGVSLSGYSRRSRVAYLMGLADGIAAERRTHKEDD